MSSVTPVEAYLAELEAALDVRSRVRRRFLRECRDHLADAAAARGGQAVCAFRPPADVAGAFDAEVAARRVSTRRPRPSWPCSPPVARRWP